VGLALGVLVAATSCGDKGGSSNADTSTGDTSTSSTQTTTAESSATSLDSSSGGETTTGAAACGNGIIDPGELCYGEAGMVMLGFSPGGLAVEDVTGDELRDLVVTDPDGGHVYVLAQANDHTFALGTEVPVGESPLGLLVVDVDADGEPDLVTSNSVSDSVSIVLGVGSGQFAAATSVLAPNSPIGLAAGDLDEDGNVDLVVTSFFDAGEAQVLLGDGAGGFAPGAATIVGQRPRNVALDDLDGDGHLDAVIAVENCFGSFGDPAAYCEPGIVAVLAGDGAGDLLAPTTTALEEWMAEDVEVADVDGDGDSDVVAFARNCYIGGMEGYYCEPASGVIVLRGDGTLSLGAPVVYATATFPGYDVAIADLTADGTPDLVVPIQGDGVAPGAVEVLLGDGTGVFASPAAYATDPGTNVVIAADLDSDGAPDIVSSNIIAGTLSVLIAEP